MGQSFSIKSFDTISSSGQNSFNNIKEKIDDIQNLIKRLSETLSNSNGEGEYSQKLLSIVNGISKSVNSVENNFISTNTAIKTYAEKALEIDREANNELDQISQQYNNKTSIGETSANQTSAKAVDAPASKAGSAVDTETGKPVPSSGDTFKDIKNTLGYGNDAPASKAGSAVDIETGKPVPQSDTFNVAPASKAGSAVDIETGKPVPQNDTFKVVAPAEAQGGVYGAGIGTAADTQTGQPVTAQTRIWSVTQLDPTKPITFNADGSMSQ